MIGSPGRGERLQLFIAMQFLRPDAVGYNLSPLPGLLLTCLNRLKSDVERLIKLRLSGIADENDIAGHQSACEDEPAVARQIERVKLLLGEFG